MLRLPLDLPSRAVNDMGVPADPDNDRQRQRLESRIALYEVTDDARTLWVRLETEPSPDREHWAATAKGPAARELVEGAGTTLSELLAERMTGTESECWRKALFELDLRLERDGWHRTRKSVVL